MRQAQRLRPLQMRIAGNQCLHILFSQAYNRLLKSLNPISNRFNLTAQIKAQVRAYLIIARAGRMQLLPAVANQLNQPMLNRKMHILFIHARIELASTIFAANGL